MMLDFLHDESTLERRYIVVSAKHIEQETLIILHIGRLYAQQIIEAPRYVVALRHLRYSPHHFRKPVGTLRVELAQLDAAKLH